MRQKANRQQIFRRISQKKTADNSENSDSFLEQNGILKNGQNDGFIEKRTPAKDFRSKIYVVASRRPKNYNSRHFVKNMPTVLNIGEKQVFCEARMILKTKIEQGFYSKTKKLLRYSRSNLKHIKRRLWTQMLKILKEPSAEKCFANYLEV